MKKQGKIRISQCMIVKDEEKNIERALSWGKDIMWEQIVVDTGSSDRTVELAEAMGAKVFHFPWIEDFAAAKNYALKQASGDWIAFLDADEYIPQDMVSKVPSLLRELRGSSCIALLCDLMNLNAEGKLFSGVTQMRFFKKLPGVRYERKIHEILLKHGKRFKVSEVLDASEEFIIIHTGYCQSTINDKDKGKRNRILLLKELETSPQDFELMGYIGDTYYMEGDIIHAEEWFAKAVKLIPETPVVYEARDSHTLSSLMDIYATEESEHKMMKVYEKGIKHLPQDADLDFVAGMYFAQSRNFEKGIYHLERAIDLLEKYGNNFSATRLSPNAGAAWEMLAMCYYNNKRLNECVSCCTKLLKLQPFIMKTLMILLKAFHQDAEWYQEALLTTVGTVSRPPAATAVQVLAFLGGIYDLQSKKDRVFILKAAMEADYEEMVETISATFATEELEALLNAMKQVEDQKCQVEMEE